VFLHSLSSDDARFKSIRFKPGLNILVAEKADDAGQGDSRNSTGKTSFVKVLRYVLGSSLDARLNKPALHGHSFSAVLDMDGSNPPITVTRRIRPSTKVVIDRQPGGRPGTPIPVEEWREQQAADLFGLTGSVARPTPGQIWGQFVRTYFDSPTKTFGSEADWETGARIGYLLGLSPEVLNQAGTVERLKKQRDAVNLVSKERALEGFSLDEPALRSELATARRESDEAEQGLRTFTVDHQYAEHEVRANELTAAIRGLNDRLLALGRREREIAESIRDEGSERRGSLSTEHLQRVYAEAGALLPDLVKQRFEDVVAFHASVVANRRHYLNEELNLVRQEAARAAAERTSLDIERSQTMRLLSDSVAMSTFLEAQRSVAALESRVQDLERRLETASKYNEIDNTIKLKRAESVATLRAEVSDQAMRLEDPIGQFRQLGGEIYTDRRCDLLVSTSPQGSLKVDPDISGDDSSGILGVETFLLDIVTLMQGIRLGRAPRLLVHDSHNFDATDHRQVASCLNIGARLAEQHGFQYVVTMNSDFLASVESEGAFDSSPYVLGTRLSDATDDGGLFGFRFS